MSSHPELEQLSAYLDAELEASERTALDAHLPSCTDCRATLDALRATVADLKELPEAAPTQQDQWALRSAIRRARTTPVRRWQRAAWAAGAVAAAAIAVVAIVRPGGGGLDQELATRGGAEGALEAPAAGAPGVILYEAGTFDAASAQAKLLVLSGKAAEGQVTDASAPTPTTRAVAPMSRTTANQFSGQYDSAAVSKEIDRCVAEIKKSTQDFLRPIEYDVGTFESKPAFLLFFQTSSRYELWVVQRPTCTVLYFAQTA